MQQQKLQIRFLKAGLIPVPESDIPNLDSMSPDEQSLWATEYLNVQSDESIVQAMHDFVKTHGAFEAFDEITAEAIQDPDKFDTADESIYSTPLWDMFCDPEYAENTLYENAQMGKYLEELGFSQEDISTISGGGSGSMSKLDTLKTLDKSHSDALQAFRQEHGKQLVEKIKADENAPQLLKNLISDCQITYVGFEKIVKSSDYMPDHCVYVYLSGEILIGVQTSDKTDTWSECGYEYGDADIEGGMDFHHVANDNSATDNRLIEPAATTEEGAEAYDYLMKIMDKLEEEDRVAFRDYLLEREG